MSSRRRLARIAVMQTLFEREFALEHQTKGTQGVAGNAERKKQEEGEPMSALTRNIAENIGEEVDAAFAAQLLGGIAKHEGEIRSAIAEHAPQWPLERMDTVTRCLLLIGTYEILHGGDAPAPVVMNECIEIAKEYGEEESAKFVNGVLNAIAHA